jgi:hypothetical protein
MNSAENQQGKPFKQHYCHWQNNFSLLQKSGLF